MNEDTWINDLKGLYEAYKALPKRWTLNQGRVNVVVKAYETLKAILQREEAPNTTITCGLIELTGKDAYIEIVTEGLIVRDVASFFKELAQNCHADNFEIFPRTDDKLQINFLFYDVIDVKLGSSEGK